MLYSFRTNKTMLNYLLYAVTRSATKVLLARTMEEALAALSLLLQSPREDLNDSILFSSEDHPDSHILTNELSLQHTTIIARKDSIFSPLLFFPEGFGLQNFNRYRTIRRSFHPDKDDVFYINFATRLSQLSLPMSTICRRG